MGGKTRGRSIPSNRGVTFSLASSLSDDQSSPPTQSTTLSLDKDTVKHRIGPFSSHTAKPAIPAHSLFCASPSQPVGYWPSSSTPSRCDLLSSATSSGNTILKPLKLSLKYLKSIHMIYIIFCVVFFYYVMYLPFLFFLLLFSFINLLFLLFCVHLSVQARNLTDPGSQEIKG